MSVQWRKYAVVRPALACIAGIILADGFPSDQVCLIASSLAFGVWLVRFTRPVELRSLWDSLTLLLLFVVLGAVRYTTNDESRYPDHFSHFIGSDPEIKGRLLEFPKSSHRSRARVEVTHVCSDGHCAAVRGRIMIYFSPDDSTVAHLRPGDGIYFKGSPQPVPAAKNPSAFDYRAYLFYLKTGHRIYLDQPIAVDSVRNFSVFHLLSVDVRSALMNAIDYHIKDADKRAVLHALILGYRDNIDPDIYDRFKNAGAVHILAVSGMHVGLVCAVWMFFIGRIRSNGRWKPWVQCISTILIVWLFALLTGAAPAVMRAAFMFSFFLIGRYFFTNSNGYNTMAVSALILLMMDPYLLFQVSFQLSYLSLLGILFLHPRLVRLVSFDQPILQASWNLMAVAFSAQVVLFPLCIYLFHSFPILFLLTGITAVPIAVFLLCSGIVMQVLHAFSPYLAAVPAALIDPIAGLFLWIISSLSKVTGSAGQGLWLEKSEMLTLYAAMALLLWYIYKPRAKKLLTLASTLVLFTGQIGFRFIGQDIQQKLFVYSSFRGSLIEVYSGHRAWVYQDKALDDASVRYLTENNRLQCGIRSVLQINGPEMAASPKKGVVAVNGKIIQVLDATSRFGYCANADYYIVCSGNEMPLYQFRPSNANPVIVLGADLRRFEQERWQEWARQRKLEIYDSRASAVSLDL